MLTPCFSYYQINTVDIWDFEYHLFFNPSEEFKHFSRIRVMEELSQKLQVIVISETPPFITYDNYIGGDKDMKTYYLNKVNRFTQAIDFSESIRLAYFFSNNDGYSYRIDKEIKSDHKDFAFWFSLKLRQYELGLHHINSFLEYHLTHSFERYILSYMDFLNKRIIRQYQNIFFSPRLSQTITEYLQSFADTLDPQDTPPKETPKYHKRPRTRKNYNSYYLTILQKEPTYLQNNGGYQAFEQLIEYGFIKADIDFDFENFKNIFSGVGVTKTKRIIWLGGKIYLKLFVHYLVRTKKIEPMGNENWTTTIKCFLNKEGKEFETTQLQYANGGTDQRKEVLYAIADIL
ncbi:hypothetical protein [Aquimarina pacifica]|uniref:hypothetical protein n=1 Tax=Aquimarina pacifica TaxID=1296415 RepID=UPI0004705F14|nr:hypothetical protein [Aquimarina pacifica]